MHEPLVKFVINVSEVDNFRGLDFDFWLPGVPLWLLVLSPACCKPKASSLQFTERMQLYSFNYHAKLKRHMPCTISLQFFIMCEDGRYLVSLSYSSKDIQQSIFLDMKALPLERFCISGLGQTSCFFGYTCLESTSTSPET